MAKRSMRVELPKNIPPLPENYQRINGLFTTGFRVTSTNAGDGFLYQLKTPISIYGFQVANVAAIIDFPDTENNPVGEETPIGTGLLSVINNADTYQVNAGVPYIFSIPIVTRYISIRRNGGTSASPVQFWIYWNYPINR